VEKQPRGLVWDIETSPIISYNWGVWEQNAIEVIEDWKILSVAWQWVGESKIHVIGQDDFKDWVPGVNNDYGVCAKLWHLLDECDYEVSHNGDQFDVKKANARFLVHGFQPPSPYKQIDTKKIAKRVAGFTSNKLKDLAHDLHVAQKGDPGGFATWKGCLAGDKKAWKKLKSYNKQDIPPLMDLYLMFRPWDKQAFKMNAFMGRPDACPKCGKEGSMNKVNKYTSTRTGVTKQYYRCSVPACGGMAESLVREPNTERMLYG